MRRRCVVVNHHLGLMKGPGRNGGTGDESQPQQSGTHSVQLHLVVVSTMVPGRMVGSRVMTAAGPGR
jgi:hypothetical protein